MRYLKKILCALLICGLIISCSKKDKENEKKIMDSTKKIETTNKVNKEEEIKTNKVNNDEVVKTDEKIVLAKVADKEILKSTVDEKLFQISKQYRVPEEQKEAFKKQVYPNILNTLIEMEVVLYGADKQNITVNDQEIKDEFDKFKQNLKIRNGNSDSSKSFEIFLAENNLTVEKLTEEIKKGLKTQKFYEKKTADIKEATEEDCKKFYDENKAKFQQPEQVRASHILVKVDPNDSEEIKKEKLAKIQNILEETKKENADFAELAKKYSDCPSKSKGGDLNFFTRDRMVKPFSDAAFEMEDNEISDIVETQFGYHIIKRTASKAANQINYDDVKDEISKQLTVKRKNEEFAKWVEAEKKVIVEMIEKK